MSQSGDKDSWPKLLFFKDTVTPWTSTLSLHDALQICSGLVCGAARPGDGPRRSFLSCRSRRTRRPPSDRKSTRLNSSHANISYAVFCLTKIDHRVAVEPADQLVS